MSTATCDIITEANMPSTIAYATRLVGLRRLIETTGKQADYVVALCDAHVTHHAETAFVNLPKALEDDQRYCAFCVKNAGFTFAVKLSYFKPCGKFYTSGYYFTEKQHIFEVSDEVHEMLQAGVNPGLTPGAVGRNEFITQITVTNHPGRFPVLVLKP